jgi:hypothetical protein
MREHSSGEPLITESFGFQKIDGYPASDDGFCTSEWDGSISNLFFVMKTNPNNEKFSDLVAACLVRQGYAPDGFTGADFEELENQASETSYCSAGPDPDKEPDCKIISSVTNPDPDLPGGMKLYAPETEECRTTPLTVGVE